MILRLGWPVTIAGALAASSVSVAAQVPSVTRSPQVAGETLRVVTGGALPLVVADVSVTSDTTRAAMAIDRAWARTERQAPLPPRFVFQPAALRPAIVALVQVRLARDTGWNARTGAPLHGSAYRTLASDVLAAVQASRIGTVFAQHGYRFGTTGRVSGVEVGTVAGHGRALLPTEIADMGLVATRIR